MNIDKIVKKAMIDADLTCDDEECGHVIYAPDEDCY